jgi:hypothetical protein
MTWYAAAAENDTPEADYETRLCNVQACIMAPCLCGHFGN